MEVLSQGRAAVYEEPTGPSGVRMREIPKTNPQPGYVSVALRTAALNHLDLWLTHGAQRIKPPRVICADGAGVVEASRSQRWHAGDEVVIYPVSCCWECEACRAGEQVLCPQFGIVGENTDGTACELIHVHERNLYRRPRDLSWDEAGAFPLTFLTAWRMLVTRARLKRGETLLVVGAGAGVAAAAITIGRHLGARVYATSRSEHKRRRARNIGAEQVFDSAEFSKQVREATGGKGVDVVFEHVGPATLEESIRSVRKAGRIVFCGSTSGVKAEITMPRIFLQQVELLGSTMGNAAEFEAVLGVIGHGMRPYVDASYPLHEVQAALEHLDRSEQFGKVVLRIA